MDYREFPSSQPGVGTPLASVAEPYHAHPSTTTALLTHKSQALIQTLPTLLAPFAPITLAEMQDVALLDRIETKYVMHAQTLLDILSAVQPYYRVLSVAGELLARYQTLYYDTADFALYHSHHAGLSNRYKVRTREYVDSALAFLEVKHKTNKNRTVKQRLPIAQPMPNFAEADSDDLAAFLHNNTPYPVQALHPVLWNRYWRITLVGKQTLERITLDVDLRFFWQDQQQQIPHLIIAEVKQAGRHQPSPFTQQLPERKSAVGWRNLSLPRRQHR